MHVKLAVSAGVDRKCTLCIVDRYMPLVHLSSMSPRFTIMVSDTDGTSIHASLHLRCRHNTPFSQLAAKGRQLDL